jgi:hypothetical protein
MTDDFFRLDIYERVRMLLGAKIEFFAGDTLVDRRIALAAMREQSAA